MNTKVPTTVFSGFLGSGKTTIISNLIDDLQSQNQQVVYIKNEIGSADVDTKILKGRGIETKELLNGCICCTLVGPFANAVNELIEDFNPDRIIIEASGAADPSALALMISSHPKLERDGIIGIIDVVNFQGYKDLSITAQNQTKFTDLLVFNKVELADDDQKRAVVGYVRELNTHSPIIEAHNGKISSELIFGLSQTELNSILEKTTIIKSDHINKDEIQTFNLKPAGKFDQKTLEKTLSECPKNIFRIKGFVKLNNDIYYLFNTVGKRTDFKLIEDANISENLFIFIGFLAHEHEAEIKVALEKIAIF
ncbi:MAG: GTP-binding protein [Pseudomonadales bacterium]|nr:GTP-binding protein [Pseudomonadales bacterium]